MSKHRIVITIVDKDNGRADVDVKCDPEWDTNTAKSEGIHLLLNFLMAIQHIADGREQAMCVDTAGNQHHGWLHEVLRKELDDRSRAAGS